MQLPEFLVPAVQQLEDPLLFLPLGSEFDLLVPQPLRALLEGILVAGDLLAPLQEIQLEVGLEVFYFCDEFLLFQGEKVVVVVEFLLHELPFLFQPLLFLLQLGESVVEVLNESEMSEDGLLLLAVEVEFPLESFLQLLEVGKQRFFVVLEVLSVCSQLVLEVVTALIQPGEVPGEGGSLLPDPVANPQAVLRQQVAAPLQLSHELTPPLLLQLNPLLHDCAFYGCEPLLHLAFILVLYFTQRNVLCQFGVADRLLQVPLFPILPLASNFPVSGLAPSGA